MKKNRFLMLCASFLLAGMFIGCANGGSEGNEGNGGGGASGSGTIAEINALVTDLKLPESVGGANPFVDFFGKKISCYDSTYDKNIVYEFSDTDVTVTEMYDDEDGDDFFVYKYSYTYNTLTKKIFLKLKYRKSVYLNKIAEGSSAGEAIINFAKVFGEAPEDEKYRFINDFSCGSSYEYNIVNNTVTLKDCFETPLLSENSLGYHKESSFSLTDDYEALIFGCEGNEINGKIVLSSYETGIGKCLGDFTATYSVSDGNMTVDFLTYPDGLADVCTQETVILRDNKITLTLENLDDDDSDIDDIETLVSECTLPASVGSENPFTAFFGKKISYEGDDKSIAYEFAANEVIVTEIYNEGRKTWTWVKKYSYTYNTVTKRIFLKLKYEKYIDQEITCEGSSAGEFIVNSSKITGEKLSEYDKYLFVSSFSSGLSYEYEIEDNAILLKTCFENPLLSRNSISGSNINSFYLEQEQTGRSHEAIIFDFEDNKIEGIIFPYKGEGKCLGDFTATYFVSDGNMTVDFLTYPDGLADVCTQETVILRDNEITLTLENLDDDDSDIDDIETLVSAYTLPASVGENPFTEFFGKELKKNSHSFKITQDEFIDINDDDSKAPFSKKIYSYTYNTEERTLYCKIKSISGSNGDISFTANSATEYWKEALKYAEPNAESKYYVARFFSEGLSYKYEINNDNIILTHYMTDNLMLSMNCGTKSDDNEPYLIIGGQVCWDTFDDPQYPSESYSTSCYGTIIKNDVSTKTVNGILNFCYNAHDNSSKGEIIKGNFTANYEVTTAQDGSQKLTFTFTALPSDFEKFQKTYIMDVNHRVETLSVSES